MTSKSMKLARQADDQITFSSIAELKAKADNTIGEYQRAMRNGVDTLFLAELINSPDEYGRLAGVGVDWVVQAGDNGYNVKSFGAVGDYAGLVDDYDAIQAALDTRKAVFIPGDQYYVSQTLAPHKQQEITGEGGVQRGALSSSSVTSLWFPVGVDGYDTSVNIALGCKLKQMAVRAIDQVTGNGSVGIKMGVKGVSGGVSQNIKVELHDLYVAGFDIDYGLYGWSWEVTIHRCMADYARTAGFDVADNATIVSMTDCSAFLAGSPYGTSPANNTSVGWNLEEGQIYLHSPRAENVQNTGFVLASKAKVVIDSPYCEGNRIHDITLTPDFSGQLIINGGRMIHENDGVDTFACIRNTSTEKCFVKVTGVQYQIGTTSTNTTTAGFYYAESQVPHVVIDGLIVDGDVSVMTTGNKRVVYLSQGGRYAPSEFSVSDLPDVRFYRRGTSHMARVNGSLPTSLLISDGTNTHDMLTDNSIAELNGRTYRWVSAKNDWALVTPRSFGKILLKNSNDSGIEEWWGETQGIEIVRFGGGPASNTVKIDTTGVSDGACFYVRSYSTATTPATITVNDHNDVLIATITPSFTGAGGVVGEFTYSNKIGVGIAFRLNRVMREN